MRALAAFGLALLLAACAGGATVTRGGGQTIAQAQAESANGPKYRVAVGGILDKTDPSSEQSIAKQIALLNAGKPKDQQLTPNALTQGIRDMLVTELFNSGQFIVLERDALNEAMLEQEFSASARAGDATRIPPGQLEGAELLVVGAVTAFDAGAGSSGFAIPIPVPLGTDYRNGAALFNLSFKRGYVAMDLRIIDVASGRIVASTAVEGKNTKYGVNLQGLAGGNFGYIPLPKGLVGYFQNTPVQEALQKMVAAAIGTIAAQQPTKPQPAARPSAAADRPAAPGPAAAH
ncbi:MAG: CsgG/HfaB family protein [Nevskia sp.]|nr:CsgG/HfaB family protein [Nevskia sp.]